MKLKIKALTWQGKLRLVITNLGRAPVKINHPAAGREQSASQNAGRTIIDEMDTGLIEVELVEQAI
jgi:hypothetical protein